MDTLICDIKRFAVHDGDGVRTTVFFKGCPLKCAWCHNPESISYTPQLSYTKHKCINCGECVKICGAHSISDGVHKYEREKCINCGKCEPVCLGEALKLYGTKADINYLFDKLTEDKMFYETSGGGVTLSGGECLTHADFCADLLKKLKNAGINTAVDTCGFVSKDAIDKVINYTDVFLYDMKAINEATHIKFTGQSNKIILENLLYIDSKGAKTEIRIPFVPEANADEIEDMAKFMSRLANLTKVRVLPYHSYAAGKYDALGMKNTLPEIIPAEEQINKAKEIIRSYNIKVMD